MVRSDQGSSGVMFSIDTESGHPDMVFITGAWGLGENVVQVRKKSYCVAPALTSRALGDSGRLWVMMPLYSCSYST